MTHDRHLTPPELNALTDEAAAAIIQQAADKVLTVEEWLDQEIAAARRGLPWWRLPW